VMRHAAYMDDGKTSLRTLDEALRLLEGLRGSTFVCMRSFAGSFGETPLHIMAARRELADEQYVAGRATIQALVHAGFGVDDQDDEGWTPLHWAAFTQSAWTTRFLLRNGANPMVVNYHGQTALQIARARPAAFLHKDPSREVEQLLEAAAMPWMPRGTNGASSVDVG